jgi:transcriptional regulator with XRE-family HTH domain
MPAFSPTLLRARREAIGLSKEQLAVGADRSYPTIARLERGEIRPSVATLGRLSAVLKCSVADLFDADETDDDTRPTDLGADVDDWIARTLADAPPMSEETARRVSAALFGRAS